MALQWDFREVSGTVTEKREDKEYTFRFFQGNALMIVIHEFTDPDDGIDRYELQWFFCDEYHAKNCLGLARGKKNMFGSDGIVRMTIYRDHCSQWLKLADLFAKAFPHIAIDIRDAQPTA